MSEPSKEQSIAEAKERFVNDYFTSLTVNKRYEILQKALGEEFIDNEFNDWCSEEYNKYRED